MLFADRLEVMNSGQLPPPLTVEKLRVAHQSLPGNPLLAESMYLLRYIERIGTGTVDMIRRCGEAGLPEPEFVASGGFVTIIRRAGYTAQPTGTEVREPTSGQGGTAVAGQDPKPLLGTVQETTQETRGLPKKLPENESSHCYVKIPGSLAGDWRRALESPRTESNTTWPSSERRVGSAMWVRRRKVAGKSSTMVMHERVRS